MNKIRFFLFVLLFASAPGFGQLTAHFVSEDLLSVDAAGWDAIVEKNYQTSTSPSLGGHGASDSAPLVSVKAAHDGAQVYLRFQWPDSTKDDRNRVWTYSGGGWSASGDEDRLFVMWPIVDGPGRMNQTFAEIGCAMSCHSRGSGNAIIPNVTDPLNKCSVCHTNAPDLHVTDTPPFSHVGPTAISSVGNCITCHGGADLEPINNQGGDMFAPAGTALDIWHWQAQRSAPLGLAADQRANDGFRRANDGANVAPDNSLGGVPRYVWVSGSMATDNTDYIFQSQIDSLLSTGQIAEWNEGVGEYQLQNGTPVTLSEGVRTTRHIHQDQQTDGSTDVKSTSLHESGVWTVVLSRPMTTPQSAAKVASVTDRDYRFDLNGFNHFSFSVTNNSGGNHPGVLLESLVFEPAEEPTATPTATETPTVTPDGPTPVATPTIPDGLNPDIDGSGKVDANDLLWILRFWNQTWPVE